jgi:hypothetical protein
MGSPGSAEALADSCRFRLAEGEEEEEEKEEKKKNGISAYAVEEELWLDAFHTRVCAETENVKLVVRSAIRYSPWHYLVGLLVIVSDRVLHELCHQRLITF